MKGIIFNLLEGVVTQAHGEEVWENLLESAQLDGAYTSLGNYPDEELFRIVGAASSALSLPADAIVRWFGVQAVPMLVQKYPAFFAPHRSTRDFILTLNGIIHPEVRKLYPGAEPPVFEFDTSSPEVLGMVYRSKRGLCALVEGFVEGAAGHFKETVRMEHPECMHRGQPECRLEFSFAPQS
jgi:hypothetical protein